MSRADNPRYRETGYVTVETMERMLAELVESIAAGFDARAAAALEHQRGLDQDDRDIDVVLAWECAARWIREHATNRPTAVAAAVSSPTGTPGNPCPSRIAHESGAVLGCGGAVHHAGLHSPPGESRVGWSDDDDRVIVSYGPTAALGVSPECGTSGPAVHATCDGCTGCASNCHDDPRNAVVAAAIAWRRMRDGGPTKPKPESAALIAAVDALPATSPTGDPTPVIPPNIDALIDEWHALPLDDPRSLHDYLGLTWEEFKGWGEGRASEKARRLATGDPTDAL